jgi:hypothetical protein
MPVNKITMFALSGVVVTAGALIGAQLLGSSAQASDPAPGIRPLNATPRAALVGPSPTTLAQHKNVTTLDPSTTTSANPSQSGAALGKALKTIPGLDRRVVFAATFNGERHLLGVRGDGRFDLSATAASSKTRMVLVPADNGQVRIELAQLDADLAPVCLTASSQGALRAKRCQEGNTGQVFSLQAEAGSIVYGFATGTGAGALADRQGLISMAPDAGTGFTLHDAGANPEPVD